MHFCALNKPGPKPGFLFVAVGKPPGEIPAAFFVPEIYPSWVSPQALPGPAARGFFRFGDTPMLNQSAFLSSKEAAEYLGFADVTLRNSRYTGMLAGVAAPTFRKLGRKTVRYERATLAAWLAQFGERASTSAHPTPQPPRAS